MLEDRYYLRRGAFRPRRSATVILLFANIVAFVIQNALSRFAPGFDTLGNLALSVDGLRHGYAWQLLSFQFMHANLLHLLGNCFAIYLFGREVEEALGARSFWLLYLASGAVGGLVQALAGIAFGGAFAAPVVGASAGALGLTSAFAVLYPDRVLYFFFIIPIPAKLLIPIAVAASVGGIFITTTSQDPRVADAAHLGGIVFGFLFVRYAGHWQFHWPQLRRGGGNRPMRRLIRVPAQKPDHWTRETPEAEEELSPDEFLRREVDPILDKISAKGIQSLTERERRILEMARTKMGKR
jgi:membrane associated rhomboid family serine protease